MKPQQWVIEQLSEWERAQWVDAATAQRLRVAMSAQIHARSGQGSALVAVSGTALIGLGVLLLVAHNWSGWSIAVRAGVSCIPLAVGQALVLATLRYRAGSMLWRESSAIFLAIAIGASIALIEQTFHLGSRNYSGFLLTWMLLALPLAYLLRSVSVVMLYWCGLLGWLTQVHGDMVLGYWPLLLISLPPLGWVYQENPHAWRAAQMTWVLAISFVIALFYLLHGLHAPLSPVLFASVFATMWLGHRLWLRNNAKASHSRNPLSSLGGLGLVGLLLLFNFTSAWFVTVHLSSWSEQIHSTALWVQYVGLTIAFFSASTLLLWRGWTQLALHERLLGGLPLLIGGGLLLVQWRFPAVVLALAASAYAVGYGFALIQSALHNHQLPQLNMGLNVFGAVVVLRYFDLDFSYLARAIGFIGLGGVFLVVNLRLRAQLSANRPVGGVS